MALDRLQGWHREAVDVMYTVSTCQLYGYKSMAVSRCNNHNKLTRGMGSRDDTLSHDHINHVLQAAVKVHRFFLWDFSLGVWVYLTYSWITSPGISVACELVFECCRVFYSSWPHSNTRLVTNYCLQHIRRLGMIVSIAATLCLEVVCFHTQTSTSVQSPSWVLSMKVLV